MLINTHHHAGQVMEFVRSLKKRIRIDIDLFYEPVLKGSGGTVFANRRFVSDEKDFIIAYADNLTDVDFSKMIGFHHRICVANGGCLTMGVRRAANPSGLGIAVLDDNDRIVSFVEKSKNPLGDMANCGIYVASREIFDFFPSDAKSGNDPKDRNFAAIDFGYHILPSLAGRMYGYRIREYLVDIGTPESYKKALDSYKH